MYLNEDFFNFFLIRIRYQFFIFFSLTHFATDHDLIIIFFFFFFLF